MDVAISPHPLLDTRLFLTRFPKALGNAADDSCELPRQLSDPAPVSRPATVQADVRDLFRGTGFKPTGRNKPASEYLIRAAEQDGLPRINLAVDILNAVSLHSGLPISVVDVSLLRPPLSIRVADPGVAYPFNQAAQVIEIGGLLSLHDAEGPCANAVKDSQRTKTTPTTVETLSIIWGTRSLPGHTQATYLWYRALLEGAGATVTELVPPAQSASD